MHNRLLELNEVSKLSWMNLDSLLRKGS